jgi:hypothetical protein
MMSLECLYDAQDKSRGEEPTYTLPRLQLSFLKKTNTPYMRSSVSETAPKWSKIILNK